MKNEERRGLMISIEGKRTSRSSNKSRGIYSSFKGSDTNASAYNKRLHI